MFSLVLDQYLEDLKCALYYPYMNTSGCRCLTTFCHSSMWLIVTEEVTWIMKWFSHGKRYVQMNRMTWVTCYYLVQRCEQWKSLESEYETNTTYYGCFAFTGLPERQKR